jgi:hypothetical protein
MKHPTTKKNIGGLLYPRYVDEEELEDNVYDSSPAKGCMIAISIAIVFWVIIAWVTYILILRSCVGNI